MPLEGLSFVKTLVKFGKIYATDPLLKNTTNIACLSSLTLDIFNLKVNTRSSSSGNDEISSNSGQFFFAVRSLGVLLTICWLVEVKSFIDFNITRGVRKLANSFFLVEVDPPNKQSTAFVGRFDNYVFALTTVF